MKTTHNSFRKHRFWQFCAALVLMLLLAALISLQAAHYARADAAVILLSAGAFTEAMNPVVTAFGAIFGSVVFGGALLAGWLIPANPIQALNSNETAGAAWSQAARHRTMLLVSITAGIWTLLCLARFFLSYSLAAGQSVFDPRFGSDLVVYIRSELGLWLLVATLLTALTTAISILGSTAKIARITALGAGLTLLVFAMTGHASTGTSHEMATSAMIFHLLALSAWIGPLVIMQLLPSNTLKSAGKLVFSEADAASAFISVLSRYSLLALVSYFALWFSGVAALISRVTSFDQLLNHPYGQLTLGKIIILLVLGVLGYLQRKQLKARAEAGGKSSASSRQFFAWLATLELLVMALAVGLGAAMSSSAPPAENVPPPSSPAGVLTGYDLPPNILTISALGQWRIDFFALGVSMLVLVWLWRNTHNPNSKLPLKALAIAALLYGIVLSSPLAVYARVLFSAHLLLTALAVVGGVWLGLCFAKRQVSVWRKNPPKAPKLLERYPLLWLIVGLLPAGLIQGVYFTPGIIRLVLEQYLVQHLFWLLTILLCATVTYVLAKFSNRFVQIFPWLTLAVTGFCYLIPPGNGGQRLIAPSWFGATGRNWLADALQDQMLGGASLGALLILLATLPVWIKAKKFISQK